MSAPAGVSRIRCVAALALDKIFREPNVPRTPFHRPMQKSLPAFLAILSLGATALAQDTPPAKKSAFDPTATPSAVFTPSPEPEPKSQGLFQRLFGSRRPQGSYQPAPAPPTPQPSATPAPKPMVAKKDAGSGAPTAKVKPRPKKRIPKVKPAEGEAAPGVAQNEPPAVAPENPDAPATPAPPPVKKARRGKGAPVAPAQGGVEPPPDADPETKEKFRLDQAKAKASEDPEVMELKAKADSAVSDEDARSAQRAYNKALFGKMKKIDGSLDERIDSMEAAILKRLDAK